MLLTADPAVAAAAIADGRLAALPTETVYGLGARADDPHAIARVYAAKGRPADHPLIVHVLEASALDQWGIRIPDFARVLARAFWPGPLTIVVPRSSRAGDFVTGGQDTVALRVPSHPVMRDVLGRVAALTGDPDAGVAAPSANRFGQVSPTTAEHVIDELGGVLGDRDVVLDGGTCDVGVESTIVDCTGPSPVLLRPGQVSGAAIERATGLRLGPSSTVRAPGTLASHYSPRARVILVRSPSDVPIDVDDVTTGLLALGEVPTPPGVVRLSEPSDAGEYARVLYAALREADALGLRTVLAIPPDAAGIGAAVIDRLTRAAT